MKELFLLQLTGMPPVTDGRMEIFMKRKLWNMTALTIAAVLTAAQPVNAAVNLTITPVRDLDYLAGDYLFVSESSLTAEADGTLSTSYINVENSNFLSNGFSADVSSDATSWIKIGKYNNSNSTSYSSRWNYGGFYINVRPNTSKDERIGRITVTAAGSSEKIIEITQKGMQASLSVNAAELTAEADGTLSTDYVEVNTSGTGGFEATASSAGNWLKIGKRNASSTSVSFTDSGTIYVAASKNAEQSDRQGTITITHADGVTSQTVTVTQKAANAELNVNITSLTAEADGTLSTSVIEVDTNGTGGVSVDASSTGDWLKVGKSSSSVYTSTSLPESGKIYVAVSKNPGNSDRNGTITITHADNNTQKTVSVMQKAANADLSISTDRITIEPDGEPAYIDVDTMGSGGFKAQASSTGSWLKIGKYYDKSVSLSYSESGRVYVSAEKNTQDSERTGTITISHENGTIKKTVEVIQNALKSELHVSETTLMADASGKMSPSTVYIDTNGTGGFSASVSGTGNWLKIGKNLGDASENISLEKSGKIYISASKNETTDTRKATITITHANKNEEEIIEVTQSPAKEEISVNRSALTANAIGKVSPDSVKVSTNKTGGCEVSTSASWIKIGKGSSPSSNDTLTLSDGNTFYVAAEKNIGNARTGTITVTHQNGVAKTEITVKQEGLAARLNVDSKNKTVNKDGSLYNNAVSVVTSNTGGFTVKVSDSRWLKIAKDSGAEFSSGYGELSFEKEGKFYLLASQNTGSERSTQIIVTHENGTLSETISVKQVGTGGQYLAVYTERADFYEAASGTSGKISVGADDDTHWEAKTTDKWIHISESSSGSPRNASLEKSGSDEFYICVDENTNLDSREGIVTVSAPGMDSYEITVTQVARELDLHELLENTTIRLTRQTFNKGLTSQILFTYPDGLESVNIQKIVFASNKKRVATVNQNGKITPKRKGTALIYARVYLYDGYSKQFRVKAKVGKRKVTTVERKSK